MKYTVLPLCCCKAGTEGLYPVCIVVNEIKIEK